MTRGVTGIRRAERRVGTVIVGGATGTGRLRLVHAPGLLVALEVLGTRVTIPTQEWRVNALTCPGVARVPRAAKRVVTVFQDLDASMDLVAHLYGARVIVRGANHRAMSTVPAGKAFIVGAHVTIVAMRDVDATLDGVA